MSNTIHPFLQKTVTVTSKLQITIPIAIAREVGLAVGHKVMVLEEDGRIILTPARQLVEGLAGSLSPIASKRDTTAHDAHHRRRSAVVR